MKKVILSFIILLSVVYLGFAHNNRNVHQRIVIEAFNLLKLQLSKPGGIADIENYLGNITDHNDWFWYNVEDLTGGSDHEDRQDIVYGYDDIFDATVSITHFWDADNIAGKMNLTDLLKPVPSAYTKARRLINDDWVKVFHFPICSFPIAWKRYYTIPNDNILLYHWYSKNSIFAHRIVWKSLFCFESLEIGNSDGMWWTPPGGNGFCRKVFFNTLGRLCHLLTDMGVPEHVRRSMHLFKDCSPWEDWMGGTTQDIFGFKNDGKPNNEHFLAEFEWTAEKVYKERGGFVNPFCIMKGNKGLDDPNLFLFYTLAQLSDWFVTYGCLPKNGNNNYAENIGEIKSIIDSYMPFNDPSCSWNNCFQTHSGLYEFIKAMGGKIISSSWDISDEQGHKFRDVLLPYTIRAVAGLLYRYIIEAKMQFPEATTNDRGSIYDQQQEMILFDQDLAGDYYTFRAEGNPGRITICPDVVPAGSAKEFTIESRARNVTFRAASEIIFKEGFTIKAGAEMHAYLSPCSDAQQTGNCKECLDEDFNPQYNRRQ